MLFVLSVDFKPDHYAVPMFTSVAFFVLIWYGCAHSDQELRALLGACGLSGSLALQPIGALSGGQKAR